MLGFDTVMVVLMRFLRFTDVLEVVVEMLVG
jgi:hypothetical protein